MFEQSEMADQFQVLLRLEEQAEQTYSQMLQQTADPQLRAKIEQLLREKQRHIRLTQRLIEIVEA
jgi:rubrerythrin